MKKITFFYRDLFVEVFVVVALILATRGLSVPLPHVLNRTESIHVLFQVSFNSSLPSKHKVHILCISKLCNITVANLPLELAIRTLAVRTIASGLTAVSVLASGLTYCSWLTAATWLMGTLHPL